MRTVRIWRSLKKDEVLLRRSHARAQDADSGRQLAARGLPRLRPIFRIYGDKKAQLEIGRDGDVDSSLTSRGRVR
jgi:hypothetical protein